MFLPLPRGGGETSGVRGKTSRVSCFSPDPSPWPSPLRKGRGNRLRAHVGRWNMRVAISRRGPKTASRDERKAGLVQPWFCKFYDFTETQISFHRGCRANACAGLGDGHSVDAHGGPNAGGSFAAGRPVQRWRQDGNPRVESGRPIATLGRGREGEWARSGRVGGTIARGALDHCADSRCRRGRCPVRARQREGVGGRTGPEVSSFVAIPASGRNRVGACRARFCARERRCRAGLQRRLRHGHLPDAGWQSGLDQRPRRRPMQSAAASCFTETWGGFGLDPGWRGVVLLRCRRGHPLAA